jgi:NAD(P)-dependent dehydrogenase (short-subunit alcohol dehydrogenase family)
MKNIVITGASSGIGKFLVEHYAVSSEYKVFAIARKPKEVSIPDCVAWLEVDLRQEEVCASIFEKLPPIHVSVNCAGVQSSRKNLTEFRSEEILHCMADNFLPAFNATKFEILNMQRHNIRGRIINIGSAVAHVGVASMAAYSCAKAAVVNMTKVAAAENAHRGIFVNSISPATIDTPMIRKKYGGILPSYAHTYPTGDCGHCQDILLAVKMLEETNFMTGSDIVLSGGKLDITSFAP